jgi:hypothetical protein
MLMKTFAEPMAWLGLGVSILLMMAGGVLTVEAMSASRPGMSVPQRVAVSGVGMYVVFHVFAAVVLGAANEVRLYMPIVPALFLLGSRRSRLRSSACVPDAL